MQTHQTETNRGSADQADAELLSLFAAHRNEAAFAELVRRHCGLVLGVGRRVLRNAHDAEDVFQATFLVLARDAKLIRKRASLTNWLYGVAYRLSMLVARRKVRRRETGLTEPPPLIGPDGLGSLAESHDRQLIDEELNALPEKYRQPIVLHYLSGQTQQQVADELGLTTGAVDGLLKRGRKELRGRLLRRGIEVGAAMAAIQASQHVARASELKGLVHATVQAGFAFTSEQPPAGAVSLHVAALAGKELAMMSMTTKTVLVTAVLVPMLALGGFAFAIGAANLRGNADGIKPNLAAQQAVPLSELQAPPPELLALNADTAPVEGKVTDVIGKTVQTTLGEKDGLMPDQLLTVTRAGKVVGQVKVQDVEKNRSVTTITATTKGMSLRKGDLVTTKTPEQVDPKSALAKEQAKTPAAPADAPAAKPTTEKATASKYTSGDEAFNIGATFYNSGNLAASQDPFEYALKMAPDDKSKIRVYRALMGAYRQLPEIDKFTEAADFIITKSEQPAERSLTRTSLLSFVHQRGKTNDLAERYEAVLKKDPKSVTALFVLSELYAELKSDPKRSTELLERLAKLTAKSGEALDVPASAKLAQQYVKQSKFKEGAELYEKIAPLDKNLAAWHWKDAAQAWIKAKDKNRALIAAKASAEAGPEKRGDLLLHFWHRALGQVFLETGEPALAVEHLEAAIKTTKIEGYIKDTKGELATAKEQAAKLEKK
ncbi:MAG: sigma-70 family RNA polymerase sigma factor [Planctomycetota bacterium]